MKKTIACLLALLTVLALCAACGKKEIDPDAVANAVLTDSDVPLDVGAEAQGLQEAETAETTAQ